MPAGEFGFCLSKGINISNCIDEFNGGFFTIPVTINGSKASSTSISTFFPNGFSWPKYFSAAFSLSTTELRPFSISAALPFNTSIENILNKEGSANNTIAFIPSFPFLVVISQPLMRQKFSISGISAANTGPCGTPVFPLLDSLPELSVVVCTRR